MDMILLVSCLIIRVYTVQVNLLEILYCKLHKTPIKCIQICALEVQLRACAPLHVCHGSCCGASSFGMNRTLRPPFSFPLRIYSHFVIYKFNLIVALMQSQSVRRSRLSSYVFLPRRHCPAHACTASIKLLPSFEVRGVFGIFFVALFFFIFSLI